MRFSQLWGRIITVVDFWNNSKKSLYPYHWHCGRISLDFRNLHLDTDSIKACGCPADEKQWSPNKRITRIGNKRFRQPCDVSLKQSSLRRNNDLVSTSSASRSDSRRSKYSCKLSCGTCWFICGENYYTEHTVYKSLCILETISRNHDRESEWFILLSTEESKK